MNMAAPGFHLVRVVRQASAHFAFATILAVALAPVTAAAAVSRDGGMPEPEAMQGPTSAAVNYALGATTIRVRQEQRLYRFSGATASVTSQRMVDFGLGAVFSSPGEVEQIGDRNYIQITSGPYEGWWVAAPMTSASKVTRYSTPLVLGLSARDYYGVRFYDGGDVRSRLAVTVEAETTYHADRKGTFAGRVFYRITDGPLAGRWVNAHAVTVERPGGGDDGGTTTDPLANWRGVVLIYPETDVTFQKANGESYRLRATMSNSMKNLTLDVIDRFRASVRNWSGGLAALSLDIVHVPHAVTALDEFGSNYWVGPSSVRDDLNRYAPAGDYDSIFVIWEAKDSSGERVPVGAWGLSLPPGPWANDAGYSSIITPSWEWWWADSAAPEEIFVHEWLHQVIWFNEGEGRYSIDLHDATRYGYEPTNNTWKRWLSDIMQNKVWDGERFIGITPGMWAAGTPTNP